MRIRLKIKTNDRAILQDIFYRAQKKDPLRE